MKKSPSIRVIIADDHSIVREGLMAVINGEPDLEVVAEARNWPGAVEQVLQNHPEIAVLDLHMQGMEPVDGIAILREKVPDTQIIIFSAFGTDEEVFQVLRAGARGYILKGESGRDDVLQCIRAVYTGEMWIHPVAAARLAQRMTMPPLTSREMEVLQLMVVGKSNKEIGSSLHVTEGTVKVHVNHILAKLGVSGRVEAILVAAQRGLVPQVDTLRDSAQDLTGHADLPLGPHGSTGRIPKAIGAGTSTGQLHKNK
jgi:two-component system NarL family response regulator